MRLLHIPLILTIIILSSSSVSSENISNNVVITVDSTSLRFSPSEVTIEEGDSVQFFWSGQALPHNAVEDNGLFDSGDPSRDVDFTFIFEIGTAGTYSFVCEPHESVGMVGEIIVESAPAPEIVEEEEPERENTPAVSMLSSILLLVFVAVRYRKN